MIHELRTYTIQPSKLEAFVSLTGRVGIRLQTKQAKLLGCWTTETGELNQTVLLWEYADFDQRAQARTALARNKAWNAQYLARARPMLQGAHSMILIPAEAWPFTCPSGTGIYELRNYRLTPGKLSEWLACWKEGMTARQNYSKPVAMWYSELGELHRVVHLWQYESLEHRFRVRNAALTDALWRETVARLATLAQVMETRILIPTEFSPLQ